MLTDTHLLQAMSPVPVPCSRKPRASSHAGNGAAHTGSSHSFHNKYSSSPCVVIQDRALATPKDLGCVVRALQKSRMSGTSERLAA